MDALRAICCNSLWRSGTQYNLVDYNVEGKDQNRCIYEHYDKPGSRYGFPEGC